MTYGHSHARPAAVRVVDVLGLPVADASVDEALTMLDTWVQERPASARAVYIVNAHTVNLACVDREYRDVLQRADVIFGDGTGVRWAAHARGVHLKDNLVGTDLLPRFMRAHVGDGYRYYVLGGTPATVTRAIARVQLAVPGICIAGHHHGYASAGEMDAVIEAINRSRPDVVLIAMGNPIQERWIDRYRWRVHAPFCVGVGGLIDHLAGNLRRAPFWVRRLGIEWVQILVQQPHKWRRYLLGNPQFVWRIMRTAAR